MKSMNRREGKKIAVMAVIIMSFMVIAFMPLVSATVTSFTVTPSTGLEFAVDSYNALVTTTGVTTINITIPGGFLAVTPTTGGVQIARVDFWNSSTRAYYGYATITANDANPTTEVDIHCKFGGDEIRTTQPISYAAGATNTFKSGFASDTSSAILKLPTGAEDGNESINITINCTEFHLDDVTIAIKQFVRNPTQGYYVFSADGVDEPVTIMPAGGRGIVFRSGRWYVDTTGDHICNVFFYYGRAGDTPLIGDVNQDGKEDSIVVRYGHWFFDGDDGFNYGRATDIPLVGDLG
ncbi:MAG: hypothetical protein KAT65_18300 [Methanophagales archaeon]|nr:hypothetical protein [Methanophagales archaeon]